MTGAEIVHRNLDASFTQALQYLNGPCRVGHRGRFGNLQFNPVGRDAGYRENLFKAVGEICGAKLAGRQVDRHARHRNTALAPSDDLTGGLSQCPFAEFGDDASLFG